MFQNMAEYFLNTILKLFFNELFLNQTFSSHFYFKNIIDYFIQNLSYENHKTIKMK